MKVRNWWDRKAMQLIGMIALLICSGASRGATWYVSKAGNDTLNGQFPVFTSGYNGPKFTINAALALSAPGDTLRIDRGYYGEWVSLSQTLYIITDSVFIKKLSMNGSGAFAYISGDTLGISDTLELVDGIIQPEPNLFLFCPFPAEVLGGHDKSYVDGKLYRQVGNGAGSLFFPIGCQLDYRPATMNYNQDIPDNRIHWMQVFSGAAPVSDTIPGNIRNISNRHYWEFGRLSTGVHTYYIFQLGYDSITMDDEVKDPLELRVLLSVNSGKWTNLAGSGTGAVRGAVSAGVAADTTGFLTIGNTHDGKNPLGSILPFAGFSYSGICANSTFNFTDQSFNMAPAAITQWFWDFGDTNTISDTSTLQNPVWVYPAAGNYTVKLRVTNDSAMTDSAEITVSAKPLPNVFIDHSPVCLGLQSVFRDTSSVAAPDTIQSRFWDFGDGNSGTNQTENHSYASAGSYTVKLIVNTASGCSDSATALAVVYPKPSPSFSSGEVCAGEFSTFTRVTSTNPPDTDITYSWYDNYQFRISDTSFNAILSGIGNHTISLIAETSNACKDSLVLTETVYGKPGGFFYLDPSISGNDSLQCFSTNAFTLIAKATAGQSQTITGNLYWGDGFTGTLADTAHSYAAVGNYPVKMILNTNKGCSDSFSHPYVVRGLISPNFGKTGFCTPDSILFYDSATSSTSAVTAFQWNFPGALTANTSSTKQWIIQNGPFDVTLITTNAEGCRDSVKKTFTFTSYPVITFTVSGSLPFCPGDSISVKADGGLGMEWLADNDTSRTKVFYQAGNYLVQASNSTYCTALDSFQVIVFPEAAISAGKDTAIYRGEKANLRASGGVSYTWTPAATLNQSTGPSVIASPSDNTSYIVTGQNLNGCSGSDTVTVYVIDRTFIRIPNLITPNGDNRNDAWVISDLKDLASYDLTITDYSGRVVLESSDYKNDWNARLDGNELPEGNYFYILKHRKSGVIYKGFIQVIR